MALEPYWADDMVTLWRGDCREVLAEMADASVDAVVTDPPYGLEFMGREWDAPWKTGNGFRRKANPADVGRDNVFGRSSRTSPEYIAGRGFQEWCEKWAAECLRVLKPGGYMLAFGSTRTYHRLACAIEDSGFEIRDSITHFHGKMAWIFGSGFPKSLAVSRDECFCQCMPRVQQSPSAQAAESAAQVLLPDVRGQGEAEAPSGEGLHRLPGGVHSDDALPGGPEQDLFRQVCGGGILGGKERCDASPEPHLPAVRGDVHTQEQHGEEPREVLLDRVLGAGAQLGSGVPAENANHIGPWHQGHGGQAEVRPERHKESRVEGRGDVQAPEGQLYRPEVRSVPAGVHVDGSVGRVHHGAPLSHGPVDRASVDADRSGEPQGSQSEEQRQVEFGAVSDQRGSQAWRGWPVCSGCGKPVVPAGLGTALKPGHETIVVARRPLTGTVAQNVLEYGTGALNIAACRVKPTGESRPRVGEASQDRRYAEHGGTDFAPLPGVRGGAPEGRWPTNLVFSHSALCVEDGPCQPDCPVAELDRQSGVSASVANKGRQRSAPTSVDFRMKGDPGVGYSDRGGASRFFPTFRYSAKAGSSERPKLDDGTAHSTVKPVSLMRWLVRLVTPPGGLVLDPFAGSGATGEACVLEGFRSVLIELEQPHAELIKHRLSKPLQPSLFGEVTS
jgi:DNA modification methylase